MIALNCTTSEWFDLGLHLRMNYGALKAIEADYRKVKQCMREMLAAWLNGQGGECTKHTLRTALLNIDCKIIDASDHYDIKLFQKFEEGLLGDPPTTLSESQ